MLATKTKKPLNTHKKQKYVSLFFDAKLFQVTSDIHFHAKSLGCFTLISKKVTQRGLKITVHFIPEQFSLLRMTSYHPNKLHPSTFDLNWLFECQNFCFFSYRKSTLETELGAFSYCECQEKIGLSRSVEKSHFLFIIVQSIRKGQN